jgi:DNA ligase-1
MKIVELFDLVKNTPGTNDKLKALKENMNPIAIHIFMDAYSGTKYHILKFEDKGISGDYTIDTHYDRWHNLLQDLANKVYTGSQAQQVVEELYNKFTKEDQVILASILEHNLKIGVSKDNFQKICPCFDVYEVALAHPLDSVKGVDPTDGTYLASRKLDGVRCVAFVNNYYVNGFLHQEVEFRSRQNKQFLTLGNLVEPVKNLTRNLIGRWVLDGECCIIDDEGNEHFHAIMKEINKKNHTIAQPHYKLFDILTYKEFNMVEESKPFSQRYNKLNVLFEDCELPLYDRISALFQERINNSDDFDKWVQLSSKNKWEGFILRRDTPYQRGRSKDLLKVKKFHDDEYIVKGCVFSKATYNEDGHKEFDVCSALLIEHKGNVVSVGSGLSKEQRLRWYKNPDDIVGKTITVQYFEETIDSKTKKYSLRFPTLKYVYEGKRDV